MYVGKVETIKLVGDTAGRSSWPWKLVDFARPICASNRNNELLGWALNF